MMQGVVGWGGRGCGLGRAGFGDIAYKFEIVFVFMQAT